MSLELLADEEVCDFNCETINPERTFTHLYIMMCSVLGLCLMNLATIVYKAMAGN